MNSMEKIMGAYWVCRYKFIFNSSNSLFWCNIRMFKKNIYLQLYKASSTKEISNLYSYEDLIDSYQNYTTFSNSVVTLNHVITVILKWRTSKTRRFKFLYHQNRLLTASLDGDYLHWWRSILIHGTDPAKAITISFWTIVFFRVFYFFSKDWDVTSKTALVKKYKLFVEKMNTGI